MIPRTVRTTSPNPQTATITDSLEAAAAFEYAIDFDLIPREVKSAAIELHRFLPLWRGDEMTLREQLAWRGIFAEYRISHVGIHVGGNAEELAFLPVCVASLYVLRIDETTGAPRTKELKSTLEGVTQFDIYGSLIMQALEAIKNGTN
jgi:hypothetical protein